MIVQVFDSLGVKLKKLEYFRCIFDSSLFALIFYCNCVSEAVNEYMSAIIVRFLCYVVF